MYVNTTTRQCTSLVKKNLSLTHLPCANHGFPSATTSLSPHSSCPPPHSPFQRWPPHGARAAGRSGRPHRDAGRLHLVEDEASVPAAEGPTPEAPLPQPGVGGQVPGILYDAPRRRVEGWMRSCRLRKAGGRSVDGRGRCCAGGEQNTKKVFPCA